MTPADRTRLAYKCHDAAWGYKRRPLGWRERLQWRTIANGCLHTLTCYEVIRVAETIGSEAGRPTDDVRMRLLFAARIVDALRGRKPLSPLERKLARMRAAVRELLRAAEAENREK